MKNITALNPIAWITNEGPSPKICFEFQISDGSHLKLEVKPSQRVFGTIEKRCGPFGDVDMVRIEDEDALFVLDLIKEEVDVAIGSQTKSHQPE